MLIYQDIFTGDELCSDTFPVSLADDLIFEFKGRHVVRKEGDVSFAGMNPSAEEEMEGTDEAVERGVDLVLNHRLQNMTGVYGDVKQFKDWAKEYMKKLVARLKEDGKGEDELKEFKTKIQNFIASLIKKERFKTLEFFQPDSENAADGMLCILEYRDVNGDEVPTMMLIKAGLEEIKC